MDSVTVPSLLLADTKIFCLYSCDFYLPRHHKIKYLLIHSFYSYKFIFKQTNLPSQWSQRRGGAREKAGAPGWGGGGSRLSSLPLPRQDKTPPGGRCGVGQQNQWPGLSCRPGAVPGPEALCTEQSAMWREVGLRGQQWRAGLSGQALCSVSSHLWGRLLCGQQASDALLPFQYRANGDNDKKKAGVYI